MPWVRRVQRRVRPLTYKKPSLRLLKLDTTHREYPEGELDMKKVAGGMLMQQVDDKLYKNAAEWEADAAAATTSCRRHVPGGSG